MSDVSDRHVRHTSRLRQTSSEGRQSKMSAVVDDGIGKRVKTKNGKRKNMEQKPCEAAWVEFGVQTKNGLS
jgi:hypothetical protein